MLGPSVGYTDLFDTLLKKQLNEAHKEKPYPLRPSKAGFCARRLFYEWQEWMGLKDYGTPPLEPRILRLFNLGHAIEAQTLKDFEVLRCKFALKYEQAVLDFFPVPEGEDERWIEGACDYVLWHEKYRSIGDVKSVGDKFDRVFPTKWDAELERYAEMQTCQRVTDTMFYVDDLDAFIEELSDDFLVNNLYQLNMYASSDFMKRRKVDHAWLYRYNKNDSRHMEIRFRPSPRAFEYVRNKFVEIASGKQPEREWWLGSKFCAFCDYREACWGDTDAKKAYWNATPKSWPKKISDPDIVAKLEKLDAMKSDTTALRIEREIIKWLEEQKLRKVELPNGKVFEVKHYASKMPPVQILRSKK